MLGLAMPPPLIGGFEFAAADAFDGELGEDSFLGGGFGCGRVGERFPLKRRKKRKRDL